MTLDMVTIVTSLINAFWAGYLVCHFLFAKRIERLEAGRYRLSNNTLWDDEERHEAFLRMFCSPVSSLSSHESAHEESGDHAE